MLNQKYGSTSKTIKKRLSKAVDSWLETIADSQVKAAASRDVIVMGGAIASMLLGEDVNDYDLYFRTKETTLLIAKYYVDRFNEGEESPYNPVVMQEQKENIKGETESRISIYVRSTGVAGQPQSEEKPINMDPIEDHKNDCEEYEPIFLTRNAISLSGRIQLVIRFFGEPSKILDSYDFVHAMNYFDYNQSELVLHAEALESLLSKTLIYKGSLYPIASIWRMKKFLSRGWRIGAGQQLKIMWQISELDLKNRMTLEEQLVGVDSAYLNQLVSALNKMSDEKFNSIDSTYVGELIDRIFE